MPSVRSILMELEKEIANSAESEYVSADADMPEDFQPDEIIPEEVSAEPDRTSRDYDPSHDSSLLIEPPGLSEYEQYRWHTWRFASRLETFVPSPAQIDAETRLIRIHGLPGLPPMSVPPTKKLSLREKLSAIAPTLTTWTSTQDVMSRIHVQDSARSFSSQVLNKLAKGENALFVRQIIDGVLVWRYRYA